MKTTVPTVWVGAACFTMASLSFVTSLVAALLAHGGAVFLHSAARALPACRRVIGLGVSVKEEAKRVAKGGRHFMRTGSRRRVGYTV